MSLLADFFLSSDIDAVKYDTAPSEFQDRVQHKGLTPLELSTLWCIMRGIEWDVDSMDAFVCLLEVDGGERLIHRVPSEMVSDLTSQTPEQLTRITQEWAASEELDCKPFEIRPVVDDLVRLARLAGETGRSLYLWNCV